MIPAIAPVGLEPRAVAASIGGATAGGPARIGGATGHAVASVGGGGGAGAGGFVEALSRALEGVNALQQEADATKVAVAAGERVDMTQAIVGIERANVAFQLTLQVRNKLLEAYQEVMRMQV